MKKGDGVAQAPGLEGGKHKAASTMKNCVTGLSEGRGKRAGIRQETGVAD